MEAAQLLKEEAVRRLRESQARLEKCLDLLGEERTWYRSNAHVVGVGNLVLHLCGNVDQWINATLGGVADHRHRDSEFSAIGPISTMELKHRLATTLSTAIGTITALSADDLERTWNVQGFQETGVAIVLHVVEHFSYHTGQVTLHTKLMLDIDTGYYAGQDLSIKG